MPIGSIAEKEDHLEYLDGLRGLAVLFVISHHVVFYIKEPFKYQDIYNFIDHGALGVSLFFLVSAFTLSSSWTRRSEKGEGSKNFYIRRAFRILPFWWANVFFNYPGSSAGYVQLLSSLTLTHGFFAQSYSWCIVPYGWSLAVEEAFYVLFPLWSKLLKSLRKLFLGLLIALVISILWETYAPPYFGVVESHEFYFGFPLSRYYIFFVGMILFTLWKEKRLYELVQKMTKTKLPWIEILIVYLNYKLYRHYDQVLICVLLFLASSSENTLTGKLVRQKWLGRLGILCFSMYLLHFHVIKLVMLFHDSYFKQLSPIGEIHCLVVTALVVLITYAASIFTFMFIEYPSVLIGRKFLVATKGKEEVKFADAA